MHNLLEDVSYVALQLHNLKSVKAATETAKIALDLTLNDSDLVKVSPNGISVGDRVRVTTNIDYDKQPIPAQTQGNVVGYDPKTKKYLLLVFPVWFPSGALVLVEEKNFKFVSKPKYQGLPQEQVFTDPENSPNAPKTTNGVKTVIRAG